MATLYPSCQQQSEYCTLCVTAQDVDNGCTSTSSKNSSGNARECSVYCNSGCNSSCNLAQTVCVAGTQYIHLHPDVGSYPGSTVTISDLIKDKWTTTFFASLNTNLTKAEKIGKKVSQGTNGSFTNPTSGQVVTAKLYNDVKTKIDGFTFDDDDDKMPTVYQNQTQITVAIANAIQTAYNKAKFNSSVCDFCNTDQTLRGGCGCNCSCSCSCECGCSCPCSCGCSCGPACSCSCSCNCNLPATEKTQ